MARGQGFSLTRVVSLPGKGVSWAWRGGEPAGHDVGSVGGASCGGWSGVHRLTYRITFAGSSPYGGE